MPSFTGLTFTSGTAAVTSSRLHLFSLIGVVWPVRGNTGRREKKSGREFGGENSSNSQLATTLLLLLQTYSTSIKVEQSGFVRSLCLNNIHQPSCGGLHFTRQKCTKSRNLLSNAKYFLLQNSQHLTTTLQQNYI